MLLHKQILVIGGDERYLFAMQYLVEKGASLYAIGFSKPSLPSSVKQIEWKQAPWQRADAIILPIKEMDAEGNIKLNESEKVISLSENLLRLTPSHCTIITGTAPDFFKKTARNVGRQLIVLFDRDDVAIANSIPTAEATLQIAMEQTSETIHSSDVLVAGFGRIGITIAQLFQQVGANVTVAARKSSDLARIKAMKLKPVHMKDLSAVVAEQNICINTVPHLLFTEEVISNMKRDTILIDVASHPGGVDFTAAKKTQITTQHALGLPGKYAPKSAGIIIGETIEELLTKKEY